jgi:hypothetical protein
MKFLQNKYVHIGLFTAIMLLACTRCFYFMPFTHTPEKVKPYDSLSGWEKWKSANLISQVKPNGYDEQMWTSVSIASYSMYFKNYVRPTKELDNWFPTYAWKKGVHVFTGDSLMINQQAGIIQYNPDSVKFPSDQITINRKRQQYYLKVQYDTTLFPRKDFQWFDRATWTFGWKAPNFGKYVMGWWIQTFAKTKPDPNGYFEFKVPANLSNPDSGQYIPSEKPSPAPYAYAPEEYQSLARQPNALMTILLIATVFIIGWRFFHFWIGFISATWLTLNKTFIVINGMIGLDSFAVTFSTLAFLFMLYTIKSILNNDKWWKIIVWGIGTGLISCFAVSSKLNAGMVVLSEGLIFGMIGLVSLLKTVKLKSLKPTVRFTPVFKIIVAGGLIGLISVLLFIRLNPQVQKQPIQRISAMRGSIDDYFDRRARIFTSKQITDRLTAINQEIIKLSKVPTTDQQALMNVYNQLNAVGKAYNEESVRNPSNENEFHIKKSDKYVKDVAKIEKDLEKLSPDFEPKTKFINWVLVKHSWPKAFELVVKRIAVVDPQQPERYYGTFGNLLPVKYNFLDGLFALLGMVACIALAWKQWKEKKQFYTYGILFISFVLLVYGNVDFVWQDWPRYMTPIFPLYSLVIAIGLYETMRFIKTRLSQPRKKTSQPVKSKK